MAGCKEIIKSVGFHIEMLVLKPVYSKEFALHHVLSLCEGRPRSPATALLD